MPPTYFPCSARLNSQNVFFFWFTNDVDGTLFDADFLVTFSTLDECIAYAQSRNLLLGKHEATAFDFDAVERWLQNPEKLPFDASALLDMWNLMEDFWRTRDASDESFPRSHDTVYDKLFHANNLPAMTESGERFDPDWTNAERQEIAVAMSRPFSTFLTALRVRSKGKKRGKEKA